MSRRNVFDLSTAIDKYKESKEKENALKKANNELNENIKTYMQEHDMTSANSEKYTATLSCIKKESLNLFSYILREIRIPELIKYSVFPK